MHLSRSGDTQAEASEASSFAFTSLQLWLDTESDLRILDGLKPPPVVSAAPSRNTRVRAGKTSRSESRQKPSVGPEARGTRPNPARCPCAACLGLQASTRRLSSEDGSDGSQLRIYNRPGKNSLESRQSGKDGR
ncbi:hypothetical protein CDD83_10023 [Cordyceps sp. RAO-2017]|nr:hypothetical protein CDD83_10023 [Cordyceps sp. RAO-2017]